MTHLGNSCQEKKTRDLENFFNLIYGSLPPGHFAYLWVKRGKSKVTFWTDSPQQLAKTADLRAMDHDVYVGVCGRVGGKTSSERLLETEASFIPAFVLDIDIDRGEHSKTGKKYAPSLEAAGQLIANLPLPPTMIIQTGGGYQCWWVFNEPEELDSDEARLRLKGLWRGWNEFVRDRARALGFTIDSTFDLSRVMRVPGTYNHKQTSPRDVYIVKHSPDILYNPYDFDDWFIDAKLGVRCDEEEQAAAVDFPQRKHAVLMLNDQHYRQLWTHELRLDDQSQSGYDLALGNAAAAAGWSDSEIEAMMRRNRELFKGRQKAKQYYLRTLLKLKEVKRVKNNKVIPLKGARDSDDDSLKKKFYKEILPAWARRFVYVTMRKEYFDLETYKLMDRSAFNVMMKPVTSRHGLKGWPSNIFMDIEVKMVENVMYAPGQPQYFSFEGVSFLNTFQPWSSYKDVSGQPVAEYCEAVVNHVKWLYPQDWRIVMDFLAYIYQNPDRRIGWGLILQSDPGLGKTTLLRLLEQALGRNHITEVGAAQLSSQFTDWAVNGKVKIVEDVKVRRFSTIEAMKPYITDYTVPINPKGKPSFRAINTSSYIFTTNHIDSLRIDHTDRRYCILVAGPTKNEAKPRSYYHHLVENVYPHEASMKYLLETWKISEEFNPAFRPETAGRTEMIEAGRSDLERMCMELIEEKNMPEFIEMKPFVSELRERWEREIGRNIEKCTQYRITKVMGRIHPRFKSYNHTHKVDGMVVNTRFYVRRVSPLAFAKIRRNINDFLK